MVVTDTPTLSLCTGADDPGAQGDANEGLLSIKEAALFLGVSVSLLKKDRRERHYGIPFIKRGSRYVRYQIDDLCKWTNSHSSTTAPQAVTKPLLEGKSPNEE